MDKRNACIVCFEKLTDTICPHCITEYHFKCLAKFYNINRNDDSKYKKACHVCSKDWSSEMLVRISSEVSIEIPENSQIRYTHNDLIDSRLDGIAIGVSSLVFIICLIFLLSVIIR